MGYEFNTTLPQFNMFPLGFGGLYPTASQKTETEEEKKKRLRQEEGQKAAIEFKKRMEMMQLQSENEEKLNQQIADLEKYSKDLNITINKAKKGKVQEDGTIKVSETWEDYDKLPWWKKTIRAISHVGQGAWKLATGFFGYETDEKTGESNWSLKKCLTNAAVAGACIGLCAIPYVGAAIGTTLLTIGVACGTYNTGKGVIKACSADSPEELDHAYQDIGAGLTIGVTSALGLRGLGKSLQTSSATSGTTGAVRATGNNAVSQFTKDCTINAYHATIQGMNDSKALAASIGYKNAWWSNVKGTVPKLGKSKFENARNNMVKNIDTRINKINQELSSPTITPIRKALLENEKIALDAQKSDLFSTVTKDAWKNLRTNSKSHNELKNLQQALNDIRANGNVQINGTTYNTSTENIKSIEEAIEKAKTISKQIEKISKLRSSTIKKMAFHKKFASEVEAYTGTNRTNRFGRIYDAAKIQKSDITWKNSLTAPFKFGWKAMAIPFKPWSYVQSSPTSTFYKIEETVAPMYELGMLDGFMGFGNRVLTTKVVQKDEKGQTVEQEVPVTKDVLAQLDAQEKQAKEELAKAKEELQKLYFS